MPPRLSLVVLTWNEERNVGACLTALAAQTVKDFEVVVVDAASTDRTAAIVAAASHGFPVPLRLERAATRIPIGEARNLGLRLARAGHVAFTSADAELEPNWVERALAALASCDMVYGRQVHAPHAWTWGARVRGLRYHFPGTAPQDPAGLASNVACAYRREVLERFPFDPWANAAEDVLLARRAARAGFAVRYEPTMVVRHHDVATLRQELRKNVREGHGNALYRRELGVQWPVLAWGGALAAAAAGIALRPALGAAALAALALAPAARRTLLGPHTVPRGQALLGMAASPAFDLAYLGSYLAGVARRPAAGPGNGAAANGRDQEPGRLRGEERETSP